MKSIGAIIGLIVALTSSVATAAAWGNDLVGAGDLDGDGAPDIVATWASPELGVRGAFVAVSQTGKLLWKADAGGELLPYDHAPVQLLRADLDGDGVSDLIAGNPHANLVFALSGATGDTLWASDAGAFAEEVGHAITVVDDVTRDGIPEVAVGAPGHMGVLGSGEEIAGVALLDGADGTVIWSLRKPSPATPSAGRSRRSRTATAMA